MPRTHSTHTATHSSSDTAGQSVNSRRARRRIGGDGNTGPGGSAHRRGDAGERSVDLLDVGALICSLPLKRAVIVKDSVLVFGVDGPAGGLAPYHEPVDTL